MKIYIQTLGCKVNQYETQALETMLREQGHEICSFEDDYDAFIINTCAVTAESERKSRQAIRRAKKQRPYAISAVCGCYSQITPDQIAALGVDLVGGSGDRRKFVDDLCGLFEKKQSIIRIDSALKRKEFERLPAGSVAGRTRAMLKVQDGCNNFCSYCIIPYARGTVRSLPVAEAMESAARIYEAGYKEIVVTGIEIASYGIDLPGKPDISDVTQKIAFAAPGVRVHLGSLEPRAVNADFCKKLSQIDICNHFHLSLQSGCNDTLRRMRRRYTTEEFFSATEILRKYFPGCSITADLITGFPGETEREFEETLEFIKKCNFSDMHIFPYSPRPGTPAAEMDNQIEKAEKQNRAAAAEDIAEQMKKAYNNFWIGKTLNVLFERENNGMMQGHGENYCLVRVPGTGKRGMRVDVLINGVEGDLLTGTISE